MPDFLTEFAVPSYNTTSITLAANEIYELNQTFDMLAILELSGNVRMSLNDETESDCDAGIQFRAPVNGRFRKVTFRETSGAAATLRVLTAFGNVSDSRSNISGNLSVQNAASPNDELQVETKAGTTLATALAAADPGIAALISALQASMSLRARLSPVATIARFSSFTTAQVIFTSGANTNGAILHYASGRCGAGDRLELQDHSGNKLVQICNEQNFNFIRDLFIPAAMGLSFDGAGTVDLAVASYTLL